MDVEQIRQAFADFDVDEKFHLDRDELNALFNIVFPGENHKEDVRALCGKDGLTLEKMEEIMVNNVLTGFDPARAAFDAIDKNSTGFLDMSSLIKTFKALPKVGNVDLDDMILFRQHADLDRDGMIGFDDFVNIGTQKTVQAPTGGEVPIGVGRGADAAEAVAAAAAAAVAAAGEDGMGAGTGDGGGEETGDGSVAVEPTADGAAGGSGAPVAQPELA